MLGYTCEVRLIEETKCTIYISLLHVGPCLSECLNVTKFTCIGVVVGILRNMKRSPI